MVFIVVIIVPTSMVATSRVRLTSCNEKSVILSEQINSLLLFIYHAYVAEKWVNLGG